MTNDEINKKCAVFMGYEYKQGDGIGKYQGQKVMGWGHKGFSWVNPEGLPNYCKNIADAWLLVEKITELPTTIEKAESMRNTRFMHKFNKADLWAMDNKEAAMKICLIVIEILMEESK